SIRPHFASLLIRCNPCTQSVYEVRSLFFLPRGPEDDGGLAGDSPVVVLRVKRGRAGAAIAAVLARPLYLPQAARRRRQQRFRGGIEVQVAAEIHHQQTVVRASGG